MEMMILFWESWLGEGDTTSSQLPACRFIGERRLQEPEGALDLLPEKGIPLSIAVFCAKAGVGGRTIERFMLPSSVKEVRFDVETKKDFEAALLLAVPLP